MVDEEQNLASGEGPAELLPLFCYSPEPFFPYFWEVDSIYAGVAYLMREVNGDDYRRGFSATMPPGVGTFRVWICVLSEGMSARHLLSFRAIWFLALIGARYIMCHFMVSFFLSKLQVAKKLRNIFLQSSPSFDSRGGFSRSRNARLDRNDRETFSSSSNGGFRSNMREARRDDGDTYGHSRGGHGQFYDSFSRGDTANYSRKERSDFSERGHKSFSSSEDLADTGSRRGSRGQTFGGRHFRETERNGRSRVTCTSGWTDDSNNEEYRFQKFQERRSGFGDDDDDGTARSVGVGGGYGRGMTANNFDGFGEPRLNSRSRFNSDQSDGWGSPEASRSGRFGSYGGAGRSNDARSTDSQRPRAVAVTVNAEGDPGLEAVVKMMKIVSLGFLAEEERQIQGILGHEGSQVENISSYPLGKLVFDMKNETGSAELLISKLGAEDERFRNFNRQDNDFMKGNVREVSRYVPEDRALEELYKEDAENSANMERLDDLDQEVHVEGHNVNVKVAHLEKWENAGIEDLLLKNLQRCRYFQPRRIQATVIPLIMNGYDVIGQAETGSGKTAAFILPIIDNITKTGSSSACSPIALTVAPTRELVLQLYDQARKLASGSGVTVAKAYGKYNVMSNLAELQRGCDLLFATPGRLLDFVNRGRIHLDHIRYFVIDEADQMLRDTNDFQDKMMGLTESSGFPKKGKRQTLMFSATFDEEVQTLAQRLLNNSYVFVSNGHRNAANANVEQQFIKVSAAGNAEKLDKLKALLEKENNSEEGVRRTLVFVTRKNTTDVVSIYLSHGGIPAVSIHGGREQAQREEAINRFRKGETKVLVATDVCARGIDIPNLDHVCLFCMRAVVNFDLPLTPLTYVHRIGRTGRLRRGHATSFVNINDPNDIGLVPEIIKVSFQASL
ncbi:unnamed protein product [Enterobius vermicularis]|uniref:RNA helicase n=1 Tax=Enterobius vermicularis TaxID=51028 RepID=A0A0N4V647_ENTVE|nr:unnamed protein product [Enterobius vermicularis]